MSAWYRSGTIAVAGKTVTGTGTNWTDNKMGIGPGQALFIPGAGAVKVYEIARVNSATQLTLTDDAGTVAAGQAYAIMSFYSDSVPDFARRLAAQLSYYQGQMDGWQEIMTGTGTITLEAPDGTQVTLSSFKKLTDDMDSKADLVSGVVPVTMGGTGAKNAEAARTALGVAYGTTADTVARGNDSRLNTVNEKSGGVITSSIAVKAPGPSTTPPVNTETASAIIETGFSSGPYAGVRTLFHSRVLQGSGSAAVIAIQTSASGPYTRYMFDQSGNATAPGSWIPTSDERIKDLDGPIEDPLSKMRLLRGQTWKLKDAGQFGIGFTAQDAMKAFPDAVRVIGDKTLSDGSVVERVLAPDTYGISAALHHESLLKLMDILKSALEVIVDSTSDTETRQKLSAIAALIPEAGTEQKEIL